jgi:hypothetical protein
MYGDTTAIHALAGQLRTRAGEIRDEAGQLGVAIGDVPWSGVAADAMRAHTGQRLAVLHHTAELHDDAATALDQHADEVAHRQLLIAKVEQQVATLVSGAVARITGVALDLVDPVDELVAAFRPPPTGHLAWLSVDLPGLS